jgi:hypothetical protein
MGCDIHFYVERKDPESGQWVFVPPEDNAPQDRYDKEHGHWDWYGGRNYDLFAILADVRNGRDFAGVDTGDGFVPISDPRGVPSDASPEYQAVARRWQWDGHSHSHHTLRQLQEYDWTQTTTKRGVVSGFGFAESLVFGRPSGWSGGVHGSKVRHLTNEEMARYIRTTPCQEHLKEMLQLHLDKVEDPEHAEQVEYHKHCAANIQQMLAHPLLKHEPAFDDEFDFENSHHTTVRWTISYAEHTSWFLEKTMPALERLGSPDDVRIVFFFDN